MRRALFFILFCIFAAGVFAQEEAPDWYMGRPIRNIVFEGLKNVRNSDLAGIIEPFVGQTFTDDLYWEIFGRLFALEYFETINTAVVRADTRGNAVTIRFIVTERPVVSRINFTGNSSVRRSELSETVSLKQSDVVTQEKLRLDELAITNLYLTKGFPGVKVRAETTPVDTGMIVNFIIEEGDKITIEAIRFIGNTAFTSSRLQSQLSLRTKGLLNDGAFQEAKFIADQHTLVQYYRDRGYVDAEIIDTAQEMRRDERGNNLMTITFRIFEGRLYTFGGMSFEGNVLFPTQQLSSQVYSRIGDVVSERRLQADIMRVTDLYLESGYIFNRFDPVIVRDTENGILTVNMAIIERGRAHIENITVVGNVKTREDVILREIPLENGDVFSKARVMDGLRNLYNLQFFSQVIPDTPVGSADSLMDLVIYVEEQPTIDIQLGMTFSGTNDPDAFPISALFKWTDRNFRGSGNIVGADLHASPDTQSLSLNYTHRWIFGSPLSGSFDFTVQHAGRRTAMNNTAPFFYNDDSDKAFAFPDGFGSYKEYLDAGFIVPDEYLMPYDQWRFSIGVSTGYRWSTFLGNLTLSGGTRLGLMRNFFDADVFRPFDPVLRSQNDRLTPATSIWTSISLDQRDIFFDPSRGYYAVQRVGYYGLLDLEEEHYVRTDTRVEWFKTLFNIPATDTWNFKAVLGVHAGVSFIMSQPFSDELKIEQANRLAVDGMFTGRGWDGVYQNKGDALLTSWVELRFPLVPGIISWDFFFDTAGVKDAPGDLFSNFWKKNDFDYFFLHFSYGGGFRFTIPQFPLRFSLAYCFRVKHDGTVEYLEGGIGPGPGMRFVISFALSTY